MGLGQQLGGEPRCFFRVDAEHFFQFGPVLGIGERRAQRQKHPCPQRRYDVVTLTSASVQSLCVTCDCRDPQVLVHSTSLTTLCVPRPDTAVTLPAVGDALGGQIRIVIMRLAGSESWRVAVGGGQAEHALLYVRDACRLASSGPEVPPKLAGGVELIDLGFSSSVLAEASDGWTKWWRQYVQIEGLNQLGDHGVAASAESRTSRRAEMPQAFSPRDFEHLSSCPPLQEAARRSCEQALAWWRDNRHTGRQALNVPSSLETLDSWNQGIRRSGVTAPVDQDSSGWQSMKDVAEAIMDDYQVGAERVRAGVIVLAVEGIWSNIPQPGVLLCSEAAFADGPLFAAELRRAFESGLIKGA